MNAGEFRWMGFRSRKFWGFRRVDELDDEIDSCTITFEFIFFHVLFFKIKFQSMIVETPNSRFKVSTNQQSTI